MSSGLACSSFRPRVFRVVALALVLSTLLPAVEAQLPSPPQAQPQPQAQPRAPMPAASRPVLAASAGKLAAKQRTKPLWVELTPAQQQALVPLAPKWDTLSETQKRKWLALSQNFPKMSGAEQAKLHSRMTEWVALSPQQRTQARLNFGQTQQLSPDDKKAKWEAYQALSPEEKNKLAARAAKPPATAAAVKPVPTDKLAIAPKPARKHAAPAPKVAVAPPAAERPALAPASQQAIPAAPAAN
jgi:hypothetical protein